MATKHQTASERITEEVTSWPGVEAGLGRRGEFGFTLGRRELGHLHGDRVFHGGFPKQVWQELFDQGRIDYHPVFPGRPGFAARKIESEEDVRDVIALLRLNYDRAVERDERAQRAAQPTPAAPAMETQIKGLYASAPETLPFATSQDIRAFVLQRERGNLLVYSTTTIDADAITGLGGIARHYLNHRHEAMFASASIDAPRFLHAAERAVVRKSYDVRGTFSRRHMLDDDFEVIPTPGHTPGATAFLWDSGEHRLLFTGDTIYLDEGEWVAAVLESSDREAYVESLELLRELDFDVLVPWAATRGRPYYALTGRADATRRISAILERVRRGENR